MADIQSVKNNVKKLVKAGVADDEIDAYVQEQGFTPEDLIGEAPKAPVTDDPIGGTGLFRTAVDQFNQGATAGWADELTDPLAASVATLSSDPIGFLKGEVRDPALAEEIVNAPRETDAILKAQQQESPWLSGAANIGGALTGTAALNKFIPKGVGNRVAEFAKANPKLAASIVGGSGAAAYSAGASEKEGLERLSDLPVDVPVGALGGIAGYKLAEGVGNVGRAVSDRVVPPVKRALGILDDELSVPADLSPTKLAGILDEDAAAQLQQGRVLPLTKGERSQDVRVQRQEEIAQKAGSDPFQRAMTIQQDAAYKPFRGILGDDQLLDAPALAERQQSEVMDAVNTVRGQYDNLGRQVTRAYNQAEELGGGVGIRARDIKDQFIEGTREQLAMGGLRRGEIPALDSHLDELDTLLTPDGEGSQITAVKLKELELWKKRLNNIIGDVDPTKRNTLRNFSILSRGYDDFLSNLADDAIINGDQTAIDAFKNARGLAKKKFQFQEADKTVAKILDNRELSGSQLVNMVMGANRMIGKGDDGRIVETMIRLSGDKGSMMQDSMKRGVMAKVLKDSLSGVVDPSDQSRNLLSFGKMKTSLGNVMGQKETFNALFNENEQKYFKQLYKDLELISSKQKGAVNNSSTGSYMAEFIEGLGKVINNPVFRSTPFLGGGTNLMQGAFQKQAADIITGKAEKAGLEEFENIMNQAVQQIDAPAVFYGSYGGQAAVDPIGNIMSGEDE